MAVGSMPDCVEGDEGPIEVIGVTPESADGSIIVTDWALAPWDRDQQKFINWPGTMADNDIDSGNRTATARCEDGKTDEFIVEIALAEGLERGESKRFVLEYRSGLVTKTLRIGLGAILDTAPIETDPVETDP